MQSDPVPIDSLPDDILRQIFLRLPSLATLVRAACACPAWRRAVASSPSFRRRFRELHREPLLGVFADPERDGLPVFTAAHHHDRDVLTAIGRGGFDLTSLFDTSADAGGAWVGRDCRDGYLLLANPDADLLAAVNPLSRYKQDNICMPTDPEAPDEDHVLLDAHLLSSDEDPMSFRIFCLLHDQSRVRAAVFSSDSRDWCLLPWVEVVERVPPPPLHDDADRFWLYSGTQANGFLYWVFMNKEHLLMLDTTTMQFSVLELPPHFIFQNHHYRFLVTGTTDGAPCIVYCNGLVAGVLIYGVDEDGVKRWILGGTVQYEEEADLPEYNDALNIVGDRDGFVYLATSRMVLSLCLKTMELEKLFPRNFNASYVDPYVMAWPPSLVGNYRSFAVIHNGASNA